MSTTATSFSEAYANLTEDSSSFFTAVIFVLCIAVYYVNSIVAIRHSSADVVGKHFLLVIAHPDDECMFFGPTIMNLIGLGNRISVLCLSSGNADGLGKVREKELSRSCKILGIKTSDVKLVKDKDLQDSMKSTWDPEAIARQLRDTIGSIEEQKSHVDAFITFDEGGVSSHPNHTSIMPGIQHFLRNPGSPPPSTRKSKSRSKAIQDPKAASARESIQLWTLTSTSLTRKYIGILDAFPTLVWSTVGMAFSRHPARRKHSGLGVASKRNRVITHLCFMSTPWQAMRGQRAMVNGHASQMVWFRWAWVLVGRYMYLNDLSLVHVPLATSASG